MSSPTYSVNIAQLSSRGVVIECEWLMNGNPDHEFGKNIVLQFIMEAYVNLSDDAKKSVPDELTKKMQQLILLSTIMEQKISVEESNDLQKKTQEYLGYRQILTLPSEANNYKLLLERDYDTFCAEAEILICLLDLVKIPDSNKAEYVVFLRYSWLAAHLQKNTYWESTAFDYANYTRP